jgi:ATP-dependent RNA helicase DeaD
MDTATPSSTFAGLNLRPETLRAIEEKGYRTPTDCQREAIPLALLGKDLVVQSRTGTGKTAAFGVPIAETADPALLAVQALVLAPTRELALQVREEVASLGAGRGLRAEAIYGGDPMERQLEGLQAGAHVVVGTPGRVLDHLRRGSLRLDRLRILVLDEADRMLDMGFAVEMGEIMRFVPPDRQTLLFSATVPVGIRGLIYHYLSDPEWVLLSEDQIYVKEVEHLYCLAPRLHKEHVLYRLIEHEGPASSMVFCNTREETREVGAFLEGRGLAAAMLSSDLTQRRRESVLGAFREGTVKHLVTTDVASRGIDIEDLSHVFIFSTPASPEQYIHRAGRTGRVGKGGRAISLVSAHDLLNFNRLVKRYRIEVRELPVPSEDEVRSRKAERVLNRLRSEAWQVPTEDFVELGAMARLIAEDPLRDRLVARLLQRYLEPVPLPSAEPAAEAAASSSAPPENRRRRRRRYGRG